MYFLLFIVAFIVIYVASFKDNFTQENIEKVAPVFVLLVFATLVIIVLKCIV
jgi:phosphoglycerol transferase MdoB-like AlkP superfamily enzyme